MKKDTKFREIPYNYTSFSDREIILKYFDEEVWQILNTLREERVTGRSAKLLFEVIGDYFIIDRNPYIFNDYLEKPVKLRKLKKNHRLRLKKIGEGAHGNPLVEKLLDRCVELEKRFIAGFRDEKKKNRKIVNALKKATLPDNIQFSAFHKVSHATDASDWRAEYPAAVVYPDSVGEIPGIIREAREIGLKIIPRGGGTGLTGGAVPVAKDTLVVNTEKLNGIGAIREEIVNWKQVPVIDVECGAVTEEVIEHCRHHGYIFATDPTSAWASTIGGNIAENAGGKKCVMWGTAIDNLLSYRIADARGHIIEVARRNHPYRKILPGDEVIFDVTDTSTKNLVKSIRLAGTEIRKEGLGKDITNKALKGLPGLQKEGGDGIILGGTFVLYRPFRHCRTICLEFFGKNLINASRAIVDILRGFENNRTVFLTALEHFDEKYVVAIKYRNKSNRKDIPKAVLLIDVESDSEESLTAACGDIIRDVKGYNTEGFIAESEAAREGFWKDRKNLGAIARHTNAFKLNEDIVIPIDRLPEFADFVEKLNIVKELRNYARILEQMEVFIQKLPARKEDEFLDKKLATSLNRARGIRADYLQYIEHIDAPAKEIFKYQSEFANERRSVFKLIQEDIIEISFQRDIIDNFHQSLKGYDMVIAGFDALVESEAKRKIIVATHMHAGDGNIHVNIPVHSSDYLMMQEADETAGTVMQEAVRLGGVVSGEHGIGLTKLRFIEREVLEAYSDYKREVDPGNLFNPGKLSADFPLSRVYTPSFNLLELEAFILKAVDLEKLSTSIAACVRCGKCKSVCNTHFPECNIFYNPRNKIFGVALIIEAVLFDAQTSNSLSFRHFKKLREISDHCTICHKCQVPCPVNIDFGSVTLNIRDLLVDRKKAKFKAVTGFTLYYLRQKGYYFNKVMRLLLLRMGYSFQRLGYRINRPFASFTSKVAPKISGYLRSALPRAGQKTLREVVGVRGSSTFISFENRALPVRDSVVYFPGCGSERMFSDISMAAVALLYNAGVRVVLPPEYLCCGYPLLANGKTEQAELKSYDNRVKFHKMANIISYMEIGHVLVTCGTCFEMLESYEMGNIFPDAEIMDVSEYVRKNGLYAAEGAPKGKVLYHDPCHTPLKHSGYREIIPSLTGANARLLPYCCGEGGTLALSTPELSNSLRERKAEDLRRLNFSGRAVLLTTCPSCVQGLSRLERDFPVKVKPLVVHAAEKYLGKDWKKKFLKEVKKGGYESIIF